ncbi:lipid-A-disaccharide synthase [Helicobacter sp. MIT 05-5294]|uniref:lipid-A-disaccharide synthase n=1 Tax=Helicobacter sp. MIT 05-5294 TaxID=1548150 RepID=UPI00051FDE3D|nr:lipid-A-disaccharide synthase [Helicobacter sp. MIT 05-5294]TLD87828.1 lipid-A-disaccharide synthase [Helicobacter sp. MIT 05-5294]
MKTLKLFVSAIEYSANIHLANLLKSLQQSQTPFILYGIFDSTLLQQILGKIPEIANQTEANTLDSSQDSNKTTSMNYTYFSQNIYNPESFRIMGFVGILKLIPTFFKLKAKLAQIALQCDMALFMDSSSFNIPLIQSIRKLSSQTQPFKKPRIVYYILPQVWAWKPKRAQILSEICDELWGILPFEATFYPKTSTITYVGHPLLDAIPYSFDSPQKTQNIAFLPGSRKSEIRALFPIFNQLAKDLKSQGKNAILIIPKAFEKQDLSAIYGDICAFEISFDTYAGLKKSEFAFVCSGTATLESTLLGIPTILAYKAKLLDYWIAKALVKLNYIGLANIFLEFHLFKTPKKNPNPSNFPIHPEFLQKDANVKNLKNAYLHFDYAHFFEQKKILLEYLAYGSAESCAKKIKNFAKNL